MAFRAEHVEAAQLADLVPLHLALVPVLEHQVGEARLSFLGLGIEPRDSDLLSGQQLGIPAEQDVHAAAGHVGGHRDGVQPPRLGHDLGLPGVLLGVEDVVRDPAAFEQARQNLGFFHGRRAHQHRLALLVALEDVLDDGVKLGLLGLVDQVLFVRPNHRHVGRDGHDRQVVGAGKLRCFGLGGAGHAGELVVEAEVVLEGHRGPGVILLFDGDPLFGLDRLMQAVGPAPAFEDATGELVDDLHFAVGDDVVLVPPVELLGLEGLGQLVHVVGGHQVVQVVDPQGPLNPLDAWLPSARPFFFPRRPRNRLLG